MTGWAEGGRGGGEGRRCQWEGERRSWGKGGELWKEEVKERGRGCVG